MVCILSEQGFFALGGTMATRIVKAVLGVVALVLMVGGGTALNYRWCKSPELRITSVEQLQPDDFFLLAVIGVGILIVLMFVVDEIVDFDGVRL